MRGQSDENLRFEIAKTTHKRRFLFSLTCRKLNDDSCDKVINVEENQPEVTSVDLYTSLLVYSYTSKLVIKMTGKHVDFFS